MAIGRIVTRIQDQDDLAAQPGGAENGFVLGWDNANGQFIFFDPTFTARTALSAGTGISYNPATGVISNAAPDLAVTISAGSNVVVSGTYPNFTISAAGAGGVTFVPNSVFATQPIDNTLVVGLDLQGSATYLKQEELWLFSEYTPVQKNIGLTPPITSFGRWNPDGSSESNFFLNPDCETPRILPGEREEEGVLRTNSGNFQGYLSGQWRDFIVGFQPVGAVSYIPSQSAALLLFPETNNRIAIYENRKESQWYESPSLSIATRSIGLDTSSEYFNHLDGSSDHATLFNPQIGEGNREEEGVLRLNGGALQVYLSGQWRTITVS